MLKLKKTVGCSVIVLANIAILASSALAEKPNPYLMANETWISISGTAVAPKADSFTLDYGKGTVKVEMDDWDWYKEGYNIVDGDKVTVYGKIDDDLFEKTKIEASSVYDQDMGTYFYASAVDEEDYTDVNDYWVTYTPIIIGQTLIRGTVVDVDGRNFTIDSGLRKLTIDTSAMLYNPMDDVGYQQIDKGDYVSVSGSMLETFWGNRELLADSITTLHDDK